jgi:hypothetical protein
MPVGDSAIVASDVAGSPRPRVTGYRQVNFEATVSRLKNANCVAKSDLRNESNLAGRYFVDHAYVAAVAIAVGTRTTADELDLRISHRLQSVETPGAWWCAKM